MLPAEQHHKYLSKGRLVSITGRISHSQWKDTETGDPRERYEVIGNYIGYLDSPTKEATNQPTEYKPGEEAF